MLFIYFLLFNGFVLKSIHAFRISLTSFEIERIKSNMVSQRLQNSFAEFAINGSSSGFLLMDNLDLNSFNIDENKKDNLIFIQNLLQPLLGEQVSYEAESNGAIFQEIIPKEDLSFTQTSVSSNVELEIHTEQAFSTLKPDFVSLACIRGNKDAKTYILSIQIILQHLTSQEIEYAKQSLWISGIDLSFQKNNVSFVNGLVRGPFPILYTIDNIDQNIKTNKNHVYERNERKKRKKKEDEFMFIQFDQDLYKGTTPESTLFMNKIVAIYYQYRIEIVLEAGQIVYIDNRRALHGRSAFHTIFDGMERFLLRSFIMSSERYDETLMYRNQNQNQLDTLYKTNENNENNRMILAQYS